MKLTTKVPVEQSAGFPATYTENRFEVDGCGAVKTFFDTYIKEQSQERVVDRLMLLDADDTLVSWRGTAGSSAWFFAAAEYLKEKKNILLTDAFRALEILVIEFLERGAFDLLEQEWPATVTHFHEHGIPVVVITGRVAAVAQVTLRSLGSLGFTLSPDYFGADEEVFLPLDKACHAQGTLHCGAHPKGEVLAHFMKKRHDFTPFKKEIDVFLVDDREHYLDQVSRGLEQLAHELECSITYYRIHYKAPVIQREKYTLTEEDIASIESAYKHYFSKKEGASL